MSTLARWLYPPPVRHQSGGAVIRWWERRRLAFNLAVGSTGLVTLAAVALINTMPPLSLAFSGWMPLIAIVVYGTLANLFYTAGWAVEWLFRLWWGQDAPAIGPLLWRQGVIFSVGLTLLPIGLAALRWVVGVAGWLLP